MSMTRAERYQKRRARVAGYAMGPLDVLTRGYHGLPSVARHVKKAVTRPGDFIRDYKKDYMREGGNVARSENDLPAIQENNMISVKDVIKHHKTHEDVHRSGYEKFKKSEFPGTKAIAHKHKRLWHHHAAVRTRYEALDRAGKTHVSQRQYERDSQGRFASFSLSLVDDVVLSDVKDRLKKVPRVELASDRFARARAAKHERRVLPRAHYVVPASHAAAMRDEIEDLKHGFPGAKFVLNMRRYPNPDPESRQQLVLIDVETDNVAYLHSIDRVAQRNKARSLNTRGDMSPLEPTAMVRKGVGEAALFAVFTLPEKRGMKFSRDVKRFGKDVQVGVRKILDVPRVVIAIRASDAETMKLIKKWAAQEWGAHEVSSFEYTRAKDMSYAFATTPAHGYHLLNALRGFIPKWRAAQQAGDQQRLLQIWRKVVTLFKTAEGAERHGAVTLRGIKPGSSLDKKLQEEAKTEMPYDLGKWFHDKLPDMF